MKFTVNDTSASYAINEILREMPSAELSDCEFICTPTKHGLHVSRNGGTGVIEYCDRRALLRGVSIAVENKAQGCFDITEEPIFDLLCAMPDVSRNAVPTLETAKKLFRILALEGYNSVMLYTEDIYELPNYPYFGHIRGRYTKDDLRELDDYAELLGLEMIPAIQTLAHLNGFYEWPASAPLCDCNDIMLVGDERVEGLIDEMLSFMSSAVRSRKINIGFDEAFMLGSGKYLDRNGYTPRVNIMLSHLAKVIELCKKHGYEPRMWSDMFFRTANHGPYRVHGINISKEVTELVPPEVTLVYWDYYQPKAESYDEMFRQHKAFNNPVAFAGGDSSWYDTIPLNRFSKNCCKAAIESLKRNNIKEVYVTMWKDDGATCSHLATLPTVFGYAEACWGHSTDASADRLMSCLGLSEEAMLSFEDMYALPGREGYGMTLSNPGKYIFYENILHGKFDMHIPDGSEEVIANTVAFLEKAAENAGEYKYIFDTTITYGRVLRDKAELGKKLYAAYHKGDREAVRALTNTIPMLCDEVKDFRLALRCQWMKENKNFGFEVCDIRLGGLICQLETAELILCNWLDGKSEGIEELECPRLPYNFEGSKGYDCGILYVSRWERIAGQNVSNMF